MNILNLNSVIKYNEISIEDPTNLKRPWLRLYWIWKWFLLVVNVSCLKFYFILFKTMAIEAIRIAYYLQYYNINYIFIIIQQSLRILLRYRSNSLLCALWIMLHSFHSEGWYWASLRKHAISIVASISLQLNFRAGIGGLYMYSIPQPDTESKDLFCLWNLSKEPEMISRAFL